MKPTVLLAYTLAAALPLGAQNLVPNPSFEEHDTCGCSIGFQDGAKPSYWDRYNQSPEYFNACVDQNCSMDTMIDVPQNGFAYQYAFEGDAYVGMTTYDGDGNTSDGTFREYVGCQLNQPLVVGQTYYLSFHSNVAINGTYWLYNSAWASNNLGMLFTMQPNIWTGFPGPLFALRDYAHLYDPVVNTDTAGWTLVSGSFVADSAYEYLVLGNFFSDSLTDTLHLGPDNSYVAYYFFDGVCVSTSPGGCATAEGIEDAQPNTLDLHPNPAVDHVVLTTTGPGSAFASVVLLDASGRSVPVQVERNAGRELTVRWAQPLAPGVYLLRASLKSGERFTERVVVQ
ncbi:MAG: T9SS type A sorting domain-containing protein [Flavobacteriales bacterium]